jgi:hypothetical protein
MHNTLKLGLAAILVVSACAPGFAEDAKAKAGAAANNNVNAAASTDATTTGSVKANYGSLISGIQAGKSADLSTFNKDTSSIDCVKVSSLKGDANGDAKALTNAMTKNQAAMTSLQGSVSANADLMAKIQASCGVSANLDVKHVLSVQSGANGAFTVYYDDRT